MSPTLPQGPAAASSECLSFWCAEEVECLESQVGDRVSPDMNAQSIASDAGACAWWKEKG